MIDWALLGIALGSIGALLVRYGLWRENRAA